MSADKNFRSCRPTSAIVDLAALRHNVEQVRKLVGPSAQILAVVKANAYGHGALEVARTCAHAGAAMFGVAMVDEGVKLRQAGLRQPILAQCCAAKEEIEVALENELSLTVSSVEFAEAVSALAARLNRIASVHMDIDTGMGRIGFAPAKAVEEIIHVSRLPHIEIKGIYTHFCTSEIEEDSHTLDQLRLFQTIINNLAARGVKPPLVHAANSGAILNYPGSHFTLVRPGLILYGVYPDKKLRLKLHLKPVLRFETVITFIKTICAGTTLGYGRSFVAPSEMKIATINVGYADGYPWRLSNKAAVLIRGKQASIVGRVSMDQALIDVTNIAGAGLGDRVVLLGRDGPEQITAERLAEWADTIPYEILCGISQRVPRVYKGG